MDESRARIRAPAWHRLPGTALLASNVLFTGAVVVTLVVNAPAPWTLITGLVALGSTAASLVASVREIVRYAEPMLPSVNLVAAVLSNPYMVAGYLVGFGVLDFG
jgi:hypothetical protein